MTKPMLLGLLSILVLTNCVGGAKEWRYQPTKGETPALVDGQAVPSTDLPATVQKAITAANALRAKPYIRGGGHTLFEAKGYDCSGATSYVLHKAGLLTDSLVSGEFRDYGDSGKGRWITVYAKRGHVFLDIAGLRFDTGHNGDQDGPRWTTTNRATRGYTARHPTHW
jgi:hypothetical protein